MNFLKTLDQALDFERLEKTVTEKVQQAAFSVVEEFPDRHRAAPTGALLSITPTVLVEAREVSEIWQAYEMERRKDEWQAACAELKVLGGKNESGAHAWQRRAQDAEHKLYLLSSSLLSLPDPAPFLYLLSTLAARVQDLEDSNRKLQSAADQAAKDDAEVTGLIEKHQRLLESSKELQEELGRRDTRIAEMSAAAAEAAIARQEMSLQAAEMARLQRSLRSVKEEYESTQQSLFELQSRLENLAGSRQQEAELATDELERVTKRAAELELERQRLLNRLESAQQQAAAVAAGGGEAGSAGASAANGGGSGLAGGGGGGGGGLLGGDYVLLERQLAVREEQVAALSSSLESVQRGAADAASRHSLEMATLRDQVATTKLALERLEREVARRPDPKEYQELRRRAEALYLLVDGQMQAEGWSGDQVEATLRDPSAQTITSVLQERSRKLSSEVSSLKRHMAERDKQIQDLEGRIQDLESDLRRRAQLVAQLEEHLAAAAGAAAASGGSGAAATAGGASTTGVVPLSADSRVDSMALLPQLSGSLGVIPSGDLSLSASSVTLAGDGTAGGGTAGGAGAEGGGAGGGGSLLDIVVSQRDRFRQRMVQLEEEKGQLSDELQKTRQQLQSSRNDNVALFEKIRYLERYNQRAAASGRTTVVRVDDDGVAQPSAEELAAVRGSRYQCGPFALEVGGQRSGGGPPGADGTGQGGGGGGGGGGGPARFGGGGGGGGGGGATGVRSRGAARRGGGSQVLACFGEGDDVESSGGAATTAESRASRAYEARVNPFAEFQQSEADLRVRNLQVHDRALLAGSRLLLGNRVARMFLAVYTVMLHFIILLLFFYATTPCPPAPLDAATLAAAVAATAAAAGGGGAAAAGTGVAAAAAAAAGAALRR